MDPRVADTAAARALGWVALALLALLPLRAPDPPGALERVRVGASCGLGERGSAPACACGALGADARAALGLPQALNSATQADLERVPGFGPARARAIAQERARGGPFESLEALARRVPGIGPKTLDRIRPHLFALGPDPACGVGNPG